MNGIDKGVGSGGFQHVGGAIDAVLTTAVENDFYDSGAQSAYFFEVLTDGTQIKSVTYKIGTISVVKANQSFMNRSLPIGYNGSFRYPVISITRNAIADEIKLWIQPL